MGAASRSEANGCGAGSLVAALARQLAGAGRDEAQLKAEWIVAHMLGVGRLDLMAGGGLRLSEGQRAAAAALADRVAAGEPLQYALGEAWFFGRRFKADSRALIPRPETEELVQRVLDDAALWGRPAPALADVGTGTGCIALTLALERPAAQVTGIDRSADALALAAENAAQLAPGRVAWRAGDLLEGWGPASLDAVVSNPPYVASGVIPTLAEEVCRHEPVAALDGGADGLALIRKLVAQASHVLRPGGRLWLEMGDEQGAAVRDLLSGSGFAEVQVFRDLAGQDRMVTGCCS